MRTRVIFQRTAGEYRVRYIAQGLDLKATQEGAVIPTGALLAFSHDVIGSWGEIVLPGPGTPVFIYPAAGAALAGQGARRGKVAAYGTHAGEVVMYVDGETAPVPLDRVRIQIVEQLSLF